MEGGASAPLEQPLHSPQYLQKYSFFFFIFLNDYFEAVWLLALLKNHVFGSITAKGALLPRSNHSIPHNIFKNIWERYGKWNTRHVYRITMEDGAFAL